MRPRLKLPDDRKQQTSKELLIDLMDFLERKFYQGHPVSFKNDRSRLLQWVVLWPASWLDERGVTIPADQYRKIFTSVFLDATRYGDTGNIKYLPAWLAQVIQSHFRIHGEEIYQEAKNIRTLAETALLAAGKAPVARPDPVRELAQAARLVKASKARREPVRNGQLTFL